MSTLFLCGAGNPSGIRLAINVNNAQKRWNRIVILDDDEQKKSTKVLGCDIVGGLSTLASANKNTDAVANLIAGSTQSRWKVKQLIEQHGIPFAPLVHPNVDTLGVSLPSDDITVYENATLGANSTLAEGSIVFMNAVLGHGATMREGSILGPGAVLNARVILGERAYFGTNASILPDLTIGSNATVGANSSVVNNIPDGDTFIGVPAKSLEDIAQEDTSPLHQQTHFPPEEFRKQLKRLWQNLLNIEDIHLNDNFFSVGGTSRKAFELVNAIREEIQIAVSPVDIFRYPTISAFANHFDFKETQTPIKTQKFERARQRGRSRAEARAHAREHRKLPVEKSAPLYDP